MDYSTTLHVQEMFRVVEYESKDFLVFVDHGEPVPVNELKKDGVEEQKDTNKGDGEDVAKVEDEHS